MTLEEMMKREFMFFYLDMLTGKCIHHVKRPVAQIAALIGQQVTVVTEERTLTGFASMVLMKDATAEIFLKNVTVTYHPKVKT